MSNIILIIKGLIIGFAKVMPGVSGAILALSMGVYDKGIMAITNFFKDPKKNFNFFFFKNKFISIFKLNCFYLWFNSFSLGCL